VTDTDPGATGAREGPDGRTLYLAREEATPASEAPFLVAYADGERTRRWGFFCTNCESFDAAVDTMGRVQCTACGNVSRPEEWDAAHE
jgi:hypothetical protein